MADLPFGVLLIAVAAWLSIGRFFHYQRVREIVFVLQPVHLIRARRVPLGARNDAATGVEGDGRTKVVEIYRECTLGRKQYFIASCCFRRRFRKM